MEKIWWGTWQREGANIGAIGTAPYVTMGIRQVYAGQGWGRRLFAELIAWAKNAGITRLELTVMAHNQRAIHLYERVGFCKEGIKRNSLRVDNKYVDEYYMGLLIA